MRRRGLGAFVLAAVPLCAVAGHGMLNAFNDITWLPAPGRTPDAWDYRLDAWQERWRLLRADTPQAALTLYVAFMREKLAEAEAMLRKPDLEAAAVALARHRDYLERALALDDANAGDELRSRLASALLEQRYILSVDYPDLPNAGRAPLAACITTLTQRYEDLRKRLPRAFTESLFFKEEEVRWSWEMAQRSADEAP